MSVAFFSSLRAAWGGPGCRCRTAKRWRGATPNIGVRRPFRVIPLRLRRLRRQIHLPTQA